MTLHFGPVVGRFGNGKPQYAKEWWLSWNHYKHQTLHALPLYPVVSFTPWHRGVLASDPVAGIQTHALSVGLEFWTWNVWVTIGRTLRRKGETE